MKMKVYLPLVIFSVLVFFSGSVHAQKAVSKKVIKNTVKPEVQKIDIEFKFNATSFASTPKQMPDDSEELLEDEENSDGEPIGGGYLSPEEFIAIDSVWFKFADYYSVWDSKKVNPYGIDSKNFKDTISISLYDVANGMQWSAPIHQTHITSNFGMRKYRWHYGTDLKLEIGDSVFATFDGIVRISKMDKKGYGNYVMIRHNNGLETLYGHLTNASVTVGQIVKAGELIGFGGNTGRSTGPHLHFEIRYQGNAINPNELFNFDEDILHNDHFVITPHHFSYLSEIRKVSYHKIKRGETLGSIGRRYGVSVNTLCKLNKMSKSTPLKVGRSIRVR